MSGPISAVRDAESILDRLAATSLDDDYYSPHGAPPTTSAKVLTAIVVGFFALLLTVAAVQTRNDRPATQAERAALIENIQYREDAVDGKRATVTRLQAEIADLQAAAAVDAPGAQDVRIATGAIAVTGPGLLMHVQSAEDEGRPFGRLTDTDVQLIVNGLWLAGAEAVAIDGHRMTSTSAIRSAGEAITVNYRSVTEPLTITAIGDPGSLVDQWTKGPSGRYLQSRSDDGLRYDVRGSNEIRLPAAPESRLSVSAEPVKRSVS